MAGQIDFGLLTTPNFLGDALRYQKAGTQQRDEGCPTAHSSSAACRSPSVVSSF